MRLSPPAVETWVQVGETLEYHSGLLLVRLRVPSRTALFDRVHLLLQTEDVSTWRGCLVVATDRKLRVRRPER
jgi:hypothetical protein